MIPCKKAMLLPRDQIYSSTTGDASLQSAPSYSHAYYTQWRQEQHGKNAGKTWEKCSNVFSRKRSALIIPIMTFFLSAFVVLLIALRVVFE